MFTKRRFICMIVLVVWCSFGLLYPMPVSKTDTSSFAQQKKTVKGTVLDDLGPVVGASVGIKGSNQGTITDVNGNFSMQISDGDVLVISYIGYQTQEVKYAGQNSITIRLEASSQSLSEVVVTALGVKKEVRALGYSVQAIKGSELVQANTPNLVSSLAGKMAGVNVNMSNTLEGGSSRIVIRGNNSITGNNQPLFVIDGMPVESSARVSGKAGDGGGENMTDASKDFSTGINMLNQNDIESIDVLKGPAAAALYGARGANGVVMITTKKGAKKEGIGIDFSYDLKITDPYRFQEQQSKYGTGGFGMAQRTGDWNKMYRTDPKWGTLMPTNDWDGAGYSACYDVLPYTGGLWDFDERAFSWHGYSTSWGPPMAGQKLRVKGADGTWDNGDYYMNNPNPNNQRDMYKTGVTNNYNVSFSSGGEWGSVRVSLGHINNSAIVDNSGYKQTNVAIGGNINLSKVLRASISASYSDLNRHNPNVNVDNDSYTKWFYNYPTGFNTDFWRSRYKLPDGSKPGNGDTHISSNPINTFWRMYEHNQNQYNNKLIGSITLTYTPTDFLDISARGGVDFNTLEVESKNNPTSASGTQGGLYGHRLGKEKMQNFQIMAAFHKDGFLNKKFNINFAVGAETWKNYRYEMWAENSLRWANPYIWAFGNYDLEGNDSNLKRLLPGETRYEKQINSVFGNLEMNWDNFLFLQVTGRNDWSSTLPINNNSYFYPSANASFVFNQLTGWDWFSFGKLRVAYATSANDTDPYQLLPTYQGGTFGGNPTHSIKADLPAVDLEPQYANTFDIGLSLKFLENRFKFDLTYYNTRSYNQIMSAPLALSSGYNSYKFNTGELVNQGVELELGADIIRSKDWEWSMTLNLARNENKLLSLDGDTKSLYLGQIFGTTNGPTMKVTVGEKYGGIYGWDYERDAKGNKIVNLVYGNGNYANTVIGTTYKTTKEQVLIGNATPDVTGGLNTRLRWKDFSLYALADFSFGGDIWSGDYATALQCGISPSTLYERDGNGLPYVYGDGTKANHGIIMEGVLADGTPNTHVVHYTWQYGRVGSWGGNASLNQLSTPSILKNNWIKLREITLSWNVPSSLVKATKIFQNAQINLTGRDLFYIYSSLPDKINPEALSMQTGNAQGMMFGALPGMRSFTFGIRFGF